jgi:WD40 repeat-containing protein SMU1
MAFNTSYSVGGEFTVDSADIIRLILGYLTSVGLHQSADTLRKESGIGLRGLVNQGSIASQCRQGEWSTILKSFSLCQETPAELHEHVILELAEESTNNLNLAYSILRVQRDGLDALAEEDGEDEKGRERLTKARSLEQKLAALAGNVSKFSDVNQRRKVLYSKTSKSDRRERLAEKLQKQPQVPLNRLPILLQQAMKWQSYTGQLPWIREIYEEEDKTTKTKKKKKKKRKHFDLVMGNAAAETNLVVGEPDDDNDLEPIVQDVYEKVKFGKSATCESAIFFHKGLITSSSDGLIEVWNTNYTELNISDYPYQNETVMGHTSAILCMKLSNDSELLASGDDTGKVKIWKLSNGKCLRQYQAHDGSPVTSLDLSRDSSRLLTGSSDGICREFGLISQKQIAEYNGHSSYIHCVSYVVELAKESVFWIVTGSADGTVRIWQKGLCRRLLQPQSDCKNFVIDATSLLTENPAIHTCCITDQNHLLIVPRSNTAFLVDLEGNLLQKYFSGSDDVFLAACTSNSWVYFATQKGDCMVFRLTKGTLEKTIRDFAASSTSKNSSGEIGKSEVSQLLHHPFKSMIAGFSNDKTQKRGVLTVWK